MSKRKPDAVAHYHGNIGTFEAVSPTGEEWLAGHLPEDAPRFGRRWCVNGAEFVPTVHRMEEDGCTVETYNAGETY